MRRAAAIFIGAVGVVIACAATSTAVDAAPRHRPAKAVSAKSHAAKGARTHVAKGKRSKARSSKVAAQEAARLGAAVGQGCKGKAGMQRSETEWVVLCSNGKTYRVSMPPQAGAPPAECSLAGTGPQPACFP